MTAEGLDDEKQVEKVIYMWADMMRDSLRLKAMHIACSRETRELCVELEQASGISALEQRYICEINK